MPEDKTTTPPNGIEVIRPGDSSGNGMIIKITLPSGLEIFGLPTRNFYGGEFDLGPTWNWLVMADKPFLVDAGRAGQGPELIKMLQEIKLDLKDLDFVLVTHGHEDHDGGLAEVLEASGARVKAHKIYEKTIRFYPDLAPDGVRPDFPAACWHCIMPKEFSDKHCRVYQNKRSRLEIETIGDQAEEIAPGIITQHLPGHSPDALAVLIGDEVLLAGDTILPDITPFPTTKHQHNMMSPILPNGYTRAGEIYGLGAYIRSLNKLAQIARDNPSAMVLPGHRFYYKDRWNMVDFSTRVEELQLHIVERSKAILDIIESAPRTAIQVAGEYFEEHLLKGPGLHMALNEVKSHAELLLGAGDLSMDEDKYVFLGKSSHSELGRNPIYKKEQICGAIASGSSRWT